MALFLLLAATSSVRAEGRTAGEPFCVVVFALGQPQPGARVRVGGLELVAGEAGHAAAALPAGPLTIEVDAPGFLPASIAVEGFTPGKCLSIELQAVPRLEESVTVGVTRSQTRLQDQPLRVEVIDREEIEEKVLMTPGNIAMLLGEASGLRVQVTAPALGAANVRIQGLRGRYAQLLADGLPLYGVQGDSLSLLQVPPLDLERVEVIKGAATALYGAAALGGVINLVSRRPEESERELLANRTSLEGTDLLAWAAEPWGSAWTGTLIAGYHDQQRKDADGDGFSDVSGFERVHVRPRLSHEGEAGSRFFVTFGFMAEDRSGGTFAGRVLPDGKPFRQDLKSRRADLGLVARRAFRGGPALALRGSLMRLGQERRFGEGHERGTRWAPFSELTLQGGSAARFWVVGAAFQQDRHGEPARDGFDFVHTTVSVFGQAEVAFGPRAAASLSARVDDHSAYGVFATPRGSLLLRPARDWTVRLSAAAGAFAPSPFVEETEETGFARLLPLSGLRAERARGASIDVSKRRGGFEITATAFASRVAHPVELRDVAPERVAFENASAPTRTWGTEAILRFREPGLELMLTHAFTRSREGETAKRREVPLTPRHAASFNAIWEREEQVRLGIEAYLVGRQHLDDDPYLASGRPYVLLGALGEKRFGSLRLFLNVENLLDVRQTKDAPLVRPARRSDGRWTTDAWAPLDGRVWNAGLRKSF